MDQMFPAMPPALPEAVYRKIRNDGRWISSRDRLIGAADSHVKVLMYGDVSSVRCGHAYRAIREAMARTPGLRFAHRHLIATDEPSARRAAESLEAAAAQGQFWPMCDLLYRSGSDPSSIMQHCRALAIDGGAMQSDVIGRRGSSRIQEDLQRAGDAGLVTAPALFVNGVRWPVDEPNRMLADDLATLAERATRRWSGRAASTSTNSAGVSQIRL